jgi:hypothetical protein
MKFNFLDRFKKKLKYQVLSKAVQWKPSCYMRTERLADRLTDMTKLIVAFRNFANASKNDENRLAPIFLFSKYYPHGFVVTVNNPPSKT